MAPTTTGDETTTPAITEQDNTMENLSPQLAPAEEEGDRRSHSPVTGELVVDEFAGAYRDYKRAKSPFELGRKEDVLKTSSKAIIDKASVMDISCPSATDAEDIQKYFKHIYENLIFDMATIHDISSLVEGANVQIVVVEEEEEEAAKPVEEAAAVTEPGTQTTDVKEGEESKSTEEGAQIEEKSEQAPETEQETAPQETSEEQPPVPETPVQEPVVPVVEEPKIVKPKTPSPEPEPEPVEPVKPAPPPVEEDEDQESDLEPEILPEELKMATWEPIADEDWDFEYEPLVTPVGYGSCRSSMAGLEPSESAKTAEFLRQKFEGRGPKLMTALTDRAGYLGDTVKLLLAVDGGGIRIDWLKDGEPLERSSRITATAMVGMYSLTITNLDKSDEGEYTALIMQGKEKVMESICRVRVMGSQKVRKEKPFVTRIRDFYHIKFNCLVIEAQINGFPKPTVTWFKDGEIVPMNDRIRIDETEGDEIYWLMLHDPEPSDSGHYKCVAKNAVGKCQIDHVVVFKRKIPYIHYAGMGHATPKLLSEEELKEIEEKEKGFKQRATEIVAEQMQEIQRTLQAEELAKLKRESQGSIKSIADLEKAEPVEGEEAVEGEEGAEEAPKPVPRREKPKAEPEPYVEQSLAIRLSKEKLKWNAYLTNRSVPEGGTTKLQCICSGPGSTFKWFKDDKPVNWGERIRNMSEMGAGVVVITDARKDDAGVYKCIAKNARGEIDTSCIVDVYPAPKLTVHSAPTFPRYITENYSVLKDELILEVVIRGIPKPEFVWKKDGQEIKESDRIEFLKEKDDVYYLCIHRPTAEDSGKYTVLAKNTAGKKEVAHTVVFTSKKERGRPAVRGIFHKESVVEPKDDLLENIIHPPKPEPPAEQGEEGAEAEKKQKVEKKKPDMGEKHSHRGAINQLKVVTSLRDRTAEEGDTVKLMCYLEGPGPQVKWYKNGIPLQWGQNCKNNTRDVYCAIELNKVTKDDNGTYTCVAKNEFNKVESSCTLIVNKKPKVIVDPTMVRPSFVKFGDHYDILTGDVIFEVQVRGEPHPILTWLRDGQEIQENDKYTIQRDPDGMYKLLIHNPTIEDAGLYVVKAKNAAGLEQIKHRVEVLPKKRYETVPGVAHAEMLHMLVPTVEKIVLEQPATEIAVVEEATVVETKLATISEQATQEESKKEEPTTVSTEPAKEAPAEIEAPQPPAPVKRKDPHRWEKREPMAADRCSAQNMLMFENRLKNVTVPEGANIKLVCSVIGNTPQFKWLRNNATISFSKTVKNSGRLGYNVLEILNASVKDSGVYKCIAENAQCTIECECTVTVFESAEPTVPPTFTRTVKEFYDIHTNELILEFHCRAVPAPEIKFLKDCLDINNPEYFSEGKFTVIKEPEGIYKLAIREPCRADSGRYVLEAKNKAGKEECKHQLNVKPLSEYIYLKGIAQADPKLKRKLEDIELKPKVEEKLEETPAAAAVTPAAAVVTPAEVAPTKPEQPVTEEKPATVPAESATEASVKDQEQPTPEEAEQARALMETPPALKDKPFDDPKHGITFIVPLKNINGYAGGSAKLLCPIDGFHPVLKWYKDNKPLEFSATVKNLSKETLGCIQFLKLKPADAGVYKCVVSNKYGQISTSARLTVAEKGTEELGVAPQFIRLRDYYDIPTDQLIVEAQVLGTTPMKAVWFKDIVNEIFNDDKYLTAREANGIYKLYITNPNKKDSGTYIIKIENEFGAEQAKHDVKFWTKDDYLYVPGIAHADPKQKRKVMETVKLPKKEEEPQPDATPREIEHKERMEILRLEPELSDQVAQQEEAYYKKPRIFMFEPIDFTLRLRNQMVQIGETIHLSCSVSDNKRMEAHWFKDDEPIQMTPRIKATLDKESAFCSLEIKKATLEDAGKYRCRIKTKEEEISGECQVVVYALEQTSPEDVPPTFITAMRHYYRPITNDLVIECKMRGNPKPKIKWQRDGLFVDHCDKYEPYYMEDGTVMLVINNPRMIDSGRYLLVAENRVKQVELWHEVKFEGRPEDPKKKKKNHWDGVVLENEKFPRVYPKPKEPTPPPPQEEVEEEKPPQQEEAWPPAIPDAEDHDNIETPAEEE